MNTDPYRVLGVGRNASNDEIKEAYRTLSRKYQSDNYSSSPLSDIAEKKWMNLTEHTMPSWPNAMETTLHLMDLLTTLPLNTTVITVLITAMEIHSIRM